MRHDLARTSPVFGNLRRGGQDYTKQRGYIASCSCGWKAEASSKAKVLTLFDQHKKDA